MLKPDALTPLLNLLAQTQAGEACQTPALHTEDLCNVSFRMSSQPPNLGLWKCPGLALIPLFASKEAADLWLALQSGTGTPQGLQKSAMSHLTLGGTRFFFFFCPPQ